MYNVGKCEKQVVSLVKKYFNLVVEEEDEISVAEANIYEMTAALLILNILLENGYDKLELSSKCAHCAPKAIL